jgi:predicted RecA/RadA family phage recombinase
MNIRIHGLVDSDAFEFANTGETTIARNAILDAGALGYAVVDNDVAPGATGVAKRHGVVRVPKATGVGTGDNQGNAVGWDPSTGQITKSTNGRPLGALWADTADGDTEALVDLNAAAEVCFAEFTGNAELGLDVDTGFGVAPAAVIVQSRQSNGNVRAVTSVVKLAGGNAGKLTISTTGGAGTDVHTVYALRN